MIVWLESGPGEGFAMEGAFASVNPQGQIVPGIMEKRGRSRWLTCMHKEMKNKRWGWLGARGGSILLALKFYHLERWDMYRVQERLIQWREILCQGDELLPTFAWGLKFTFNTTVLLGYNEFSCLLPSFPGRTLLLSLSVIIIISI